jgi:hypothetical protein
LTEVRVTSQETVPASRYPSGEPAGAAPLSWPPAPRSSAFPGGLLSGSAPAAAEGARRERRQPRRDREGGEADDEPTRVVSARERVRRHSGQGGPENGEQDPERVPLHAQTLLGRKWGRKTARYTGQPHRGVAQLVERRSPKP